MAENVVDEIVKDLIEPINNSSIDLKESIDELIKIESNKLDLDIEKQELENERFESIGEIIDYTNNLELIETHLITVNENINNLHLGITNHLVGTLEIILIFIGLFIGILLSFIFGVVAFSD